MLTFRLRRNVNINQIKVVFFIEFQFEIVYRSTYEYIQKKDKLSSKMGRHGDRRTDRQTDNIIMPTADAMVNSIIR